MKKILIRAGMSPLDNFTPSQVLLKNSIGDNIGNLIYAFSVFRTLMVEDTKIIPNYYKVNPKDADRINEEYDCFVIPLADAFRDDFITELTSLTNLIKKLKIPCVVIGAGIRAPFDGNVNKAFKFDEAVKDFVNAILEKSSIIGIHGEITSNYLMKLGYKKEKDFTIIGCPSMYTFGSELKIREPNLTPDSKVIFNSSVGFPSAVHKFLDRSIKKFSNAYYIPHRLNELRLVYTGIPFAQEYQYLTSPSSITDELYQQDKVKCFLNIPKMLAFLQDAHLSVGGRFHLNIASILSGTPAIQLPLNSHMREIIEYHQMTHIPAHHIRRSTNILKLFESMDFQKVTKSHTTNFNHYVDFLNKNNLNHIYKENTNPFHTPLDKALLQVDLHEDIKTAYFCSSEELSERWKLYFPELAKNAEKQKNDLKQQRYNTETLKNEYAGLKEKYNINEKQA